MYDFLGFASTLLNGNRRLNGDSARMFSDVETANDINITKINQVAIFFILCISDFQILDEKLRAVRKLSSCTNLLTIRFAISTRAGTVSNRMRKSQSSPPLNRSHGSYIIQLDKAGEQSKSAQRMQGYQLLSRIPRFSCPLFASKFD